ncbi:MBL fold metallo-hydrolase [Coxiella burnetii]|uniref:MBL fold metallo-hydrolase n=1 Tax=Coxiella burnetii TaxID=777 RepID=UPI0000DAEBEB|nr:metallo-beta-lactamase family protein [Coxiella burnetii RSA 331]ATN81772.1 MBL fold metallo-hydrolase [Coxiella burnetii]ATN83675.1 MBL fold metallo-hydrolase [Coxiella burnetii]
MKLIFLGSGSAFADISNNFQSNILLENSNHKHLLIDCGTDAHHSLKNVNLRYADIDSVYVSHFHFDHVGGLEWLAFSAYFDPAVKKPKLFIHPSMLNILWDHVLSGGLQSLKGESPATLETYFTLVPIREEKYFTWESINFEMVKTIHVHNGKLLLPSYGLFFSLEKTKIFITTDTQFFPHRYADYYREADLIFHDCEIDKTKTGVHAHFQQLMNLNPAIKSKMWLYHYSENDLPDAKAAGFQGFVKRGQTFNF